MTNAILFDKIIPNPIHFGLTKSAKEQAANIGITNVWFREFTNTNRFLISKYQSRTEEHFCFHHQKIVLDCILTFNESNPSSKFFLIKTIRPVDYTHWSEAVGHGKFFCFSGDVSLSFYSKTDAIHFRNGCQIITPQAINNCDPAANIIRDCFQNLNSEPLYKPHRPSDELVTYLDLAKNYTDMAFELEKIAVADTTQLIYTEIIGAEHENITGTTFRFILDSLDESKYPEDSKVEIKNNQNDIFRGTIVKLAPLENPPWIDIQFNHQTGLDSLPKAGLITLACSSVNYDVQSAAIESIRSGTADAHYLEDVLGQATPKPFRSKITPKEKKQLEALKKRLNAKKYPPNPSQQTAIFNGILAEDAYLVMGPPGTGKTTVILEWVRFFIQEKHFRVLVSSQNNMAVDNVLERIMQEDGIDVLRIGSENKVAPSVLPCLFENKLKSLRDKINTTTAGNIDKLQKCIQYWEESLRYLDERNIYRQILDDLDGLLKTTESMFKCFDSIEGILPNYLENQAYINTTIQSIYDLVDKEKKYRSYNKIIRFLLTPISKSRTKKICYNINTFLSYIKNTIKDANQIILEISTWRDIALSIENHSLKDIVLENVNLVGATCIGIKSQSRFANMKYDVTIIDEAGQIQIHNALVPMSVSNKLIMLGDHKQIPPMVEEQMLEPLIQRDISTELLKKSLFEKLYERFPNTHKTMLDTQFRMPSEIARILSDWFYDGNYKSHVSKENIPGEIRELSEKPFVIIDTSNDRKRFESRASTDANTGGYKNKLEACIIADIVNMLYRSGYDIDKIGAIAALKAQVALIREELIKRGIPKDQASNIVATLDSYQGQERDIILYSFVRSSKRATTRTGVGFLTELRRLNVAMSRCKKTLIMVGDMCFLSSRDSVQNYLGMDIDLETDFHTTERYFAQFIRHILKHIEYGDGEKLDINTYNTKMHEWKNRKTEE